MSAKARCIIGLDYGTNSVRALIVSTATGEEIASATWGYAHGEAGVILGRDPNLARQHPEDYLKGADLWTKQALAAVRRNVHGFKPDQIVGRGVDAPCTPLEAKHDRLQVNRHEQQFQTFAGCLPTYMMALLCARNMLGELAPRLLHWNDLR